MASIIYLLSHKAKIFRRLAGTCLIVSSRWTAAQKQGSCFTSGIQVACIFRWHDDSPLSVQTLVSPEPSPNRSHFPAEQRFLQKS